jgi:CHAD domain-containing protein
VSAPDPPPGFAHDLLAPALFALVTSVRLAAERVSKGDAGADPEAIHDLRVAVRRLRTVLRPARRVFGRRRLREIGAELKRFAQATGALRDEEVLRETLTALAPALPQRSAAELTAWLVQRARQERGRRRGVVALLAAPDAPGAPSLGTALVHLERRVGRPRRDAHATGAEHLAREAVRGAIAAVEEGAGADPRDAAAMHELRIRCKRLRYTAELFAPVLGESAAAAAKAAAHLQKRLGELHDLDEALVRVGRARGLSPATVRAARRALAAARREAAARAAEGLPAALGRIAAGTGAEG